MASIAIIGAGPAGLEAALACLDAGHEVAVYERGRVGDAVLRWGHVSLFSPWSMNRSAAGAAVARARGVAEPAAEACPTGAEYVRAYLEPLAAEVRERGQLFSQTNVVHISRDGWLKGEHIGSASRQTRPFRLLIERTAGPVTEGVAFADAVIDASGTYGNANPLGPGGGLAVGERAAAAAIVRTIPDVLGAEHAQYAGQQVVLVGGGYSAATVLRDLLALREQAPDTRVHWVVRGLGDPYPRIANDALPDRDALAALANACADDAVDGVSCVRGDVVAVAADAHAVRVEVRDSHGALHALDGGRLVALVGYRPDVSVYGELQVHTCYGTDGPMKLAAVLMAEDGGSADCLAQAAPGPATLRTTEPGFYVLGSKSYGRRSTYLLRLGVEQAAHAVALLREDLAPSPDPHAS